MTSKARFASEGAVVMVAALLGVWAAGADVSWFERHVAPRYCIDAATWPWHLVRAGAVGVALLLALVVRPQLGRAVATWPARELAVTGAGVAVGLVAALGVGELLLRRIQWDDRAAAEHEELPPGDLDPRLGWTFRPSLARTFDVDGRPVEYAINARGERAVRPDDDGDPDAPTLLVAGESIAFGYELGWEETFPALVGRALGLQVVNVGVPAYGTDQAYLRILDALPRLSRPRLVVLVFVPQEIRRNISPARRHLVVGGDGALVPVPAATGLGAWRLTRLWRDEPYHGEEPIRVTRAILLATAAAVRARGAEPLFLITNYGAACRGDWMVGRLFAGLPHLRVDLDHGDVHSRTDPHPNARGARKLADAIVRSITVRSR